MRSLILPHKATLITHPSRVTIKDSNKGQSAGLSITGSTSGKKPSCLHIFNSAPSPSLKKTGRYLKVLTVTVSALPLDLVLMCPF